MTGRVAAMLELGMGFHPDFTGRQNAFMSGQLLGITSEEVARLMPEIEAFAEIGDYIDQPVRVYSSGMQMRLAFSVATAIRPDVLIVDDIQFFANKDRTQDIFFHIFNHLHQNGKQLILTSDRPPRDLEGMEERLLSRFKWGLSADLQVPDFETRIAILEKKMYADGIELPRDVVEFVAYNINTNIRELEGALISLLAQASLNKKEIDIDLAKKIIKNFVKSIILYQC
jgi:chromosomal replication initiator protein DnaA